MATPVRYMHMSGIFRTSSAYFRKNGRDDRQVSNDDKMPDMQLLRVLRNCLIKRILRESARWGQADSERGNYGILRFGSWTSEGLDNILHVFPIWRSNMFRKLVINKLTYRSGKYKASARW